MVLFPVLNLLQPGILMPVLFEHGEHVPQDSLYISDNRYIDAFVLADFGRVDVDMDDLCMGSEGIRFTGYPVIEPHANGEQAVTFRDGKVCVFRAMHTEHPQVERMIAGDAPDTHERGGDRDTQLLQGQQSQPRI